MNSIRKQPFIAGIAWLLAMSFHYTDLHAQLNDSIIIRKMYDVALTDGSAYTNLYTLCKNAPARISGSDNAAKAVDLTYEMLKLVADTTWLQETMVPHWVRGDIEKGYIKLGGEKID